MINHLYNNIYQILSLRIKLNTFRVFEYVIAKIAISFETRTADSSF